MFGAEKFRPWLRHHGFGKSGGGSTKQTVQNYSPEEAKRRTGVMDEATRIYNQTKGVPQFDQAGYDAAMAQYNQALAAWKNQPQQGVTYDADGNYIPENQVAQSAAPTAPNRADYTSYSSMPYPGAAPVPPSMETLTIEDYLGQDRKSVV